MRLRVTIIATTLWGKSDPPYLDIWLHKFMSKFTSFRLYITVICGHTYTFYRYISDISTFYTSSFVVRSRCFKKYQMMILYKEGDVVVLRQRFPSEGSSPPFSLPLYVRDRPYVHVGTLELPSKPLAASLCSLFIPITI